MTRSVKATASSVVVFRKTDLDSLPAPDRIEQVLLLVPNVQLGSNGNAPAIRGQDGTGVLQNLPGLLGGARPRLTLQIDGRPVSYNEMSFGIAGLWDVDRVEVFRSPQSTTQGRNAIGGAIFIETADPTFNFEGRVRAIAGQSDTRQLSGVVSGPILDDQLAFRVAGDLRRSHTSSKLSGPIAGVDLNDDNYDIVRAKLLAMPQALPGFQILLTYSHVGSEMPSIEGIRPPFRERRDSNMTYGYFTTNVDSLTGRVTYGITPVLESRTTFSLGDARIRRFAPIGLGEVHVHARDRSFESVVEWRPHEAVRIITGVHVLTTRLKQEIDLSAGLLGIGRFRDRELGRGLFGEIQWQPAQRLTISGGLRYQSDRKDRTGALRPPFSEIPLDYDKRFHAWLPKVSVAYDVLADLRVGVMVQRAYNPGGVTLDLNLRRENRFEAERLWNYELFARGRLLAGKLSYSANLFYSAIRDAQRQLNVTLETPGGPVTFSQISNAPRARSNGVELQLDYRMNSRFSARAAVGLLSTRITRTVLAEDPILGKRFARAPAFSAAAGLDWRLLRDLRLSTQLRHNSSYFSSDTGTSLQRVKGSTTVDAKLDWTMRRFSVFAYARNLFDEFHITSWQGSANDPRSLATAGDPREVGVGLEARF